MSLASVPKKSNSNSKKIMNQYRRKANSIAWLKAHSNQSNQTNPVRVTKMRALKTLWEQIRQIGLQKEAITTLMKKTSVSL